MRRDRQLIAAKWTYSSHPDARTGVMPDVRALVVRFARENPGWDYSRILGTITDLGHQVGRATVSRILKGERIKPALGRPSEAQQGLGVAMGHYGGKVVGSPKGHRGQGAGPNPWHSEWSYDGERRSWNAASSTVMPALAAAETSTWSGSGESRHTRLPSGSVAKPKR